MPATSTTSSPPGSGFTPRKEFIPDQRSPPNTFAVLALSSSNFIRLYSFSQSVIDSLVRLFEKQGIDIACREDLPLDLYELSIDQKPWANPKSVFTEKLILDIFSVIYRSDYTFLSCIDYGREPDDRLAMAFSRPSSSTGSSTGTPLLGDLPPLDDSYSSLPERPKRIPFALSFFSTTVMRVISPPLHLTPAILQAVRGSWPRGVVSEKKVGDNCFEFKLKGYKWFQTDNFAFDSLQHILSLLALLDAQSFTLLTSISLTNRSRVKDLWIFTGSAQEDRGSAVESRRHISEGSGTYSQHQNVVGEINYDHIRPATEDMNQRHLNGSSTTLPAHLLRKPAPRAQVPVSVIQETEPDTYEELGYFHGRANIPSIISSNSPNMTGVGAIGQAHDSSPFGQIDCASPYGGPPYPAFAPPIHPIPRLPTNDHSQDLERGTTPPPPSNSPPSNPTRKNESESDHIHDPPVSNTLLSPGTFRDSALSSQSDMNQSIPVKWTGSGKEGGPILTRLRSGSAPTLPGGWHATPIDESDGEFCGHAEPTQAQTPIHEMLSRIESPEVVQPNVALRKSEAVVFGMITATTPTPPLPKLPPSPPRSPLIFQPDRTPSKASEKSSRRDGHPQGGHGWVLVNVESSRAASPSVESSTMKSFLHPSSNASTPNLSRSTLPQDQQQPPTAAAKAIAIMDAMESKHKKSWSTSVNREFGEGGSGVRRFFSLNKKNSVRELV